MRVLRLAPLLLLVLAAPIAPAATPEVEPSAPRGETAVLLGGKRVAVTYGRPELRGRPIFGVLVPWGEVWRTGADEASKLSTEIDLRFPGATVPAGEYALFTIPGERSWQLILNRVADQWGAFDYDPDEDALRTAMMLDPVAAPIDRLSIALTPEGERGATLWIGWDKTLARVSFEAAAPAQ